jgi:hypothetical protein
MIPRLLLCTLLAGCVVTQERAATMSNYDLCEAYYSPFSSYQSRINAGVEAKNRGFDCRPLRAQIEAGYDAALDRLERSIHQAAKPGIPQQIICNTVPRQDGTYTTYCH